MATKKIDPELQRQISGSAASDEPVEAVVVLRPEKPSEVTASPERVEKITHDVLERVEQTQGTHPQRVNVFRNLGSFVVSAPKGFVQELLRQPEVASAMANRQQESSVIAPRNTRPVEIVKPAKKSAISARKKRRTRSTRKAKR